jgi:hypothetical protein
MPEKQTLRRARRAKRQGKAATTQAGAFVREEMEHKKRGKHPVKNRKQAIAIGLSKARRAGVKVPKKSSRAPKSRKSRSAAYRKGRKSGARRRGSKS